MAKITKSASSRISSKKTTSPKKSVKAVAAKKVAARKAAQRSAPAKKVLGIEKAAAKTRKLPTPQESKPDSTPVEKQSKPSVVHLPSLQQLLEAGAHFGHKVSRWNPAMKSYVFDVRNGMHVIDLTQTIGLLESAAHFLSDVTKTGNVLLVGTKGQAATIIKNAGVDHGAYYISRRWPGGLLTNFKVVRRSVKRLLELEENLASGKEYETKRERLVLEREQDRLARLYEGIRFMESMPAAMVVIDTRVEKNAIKEARKIGIPVVAIVDTNCDPSLVTYPIPGNDDAIKSIELFMGVLVEAFSNTETSARLIGKRNDYHSRIDIMRKQREEEDARKKREAELEVLRLKAMKEGKTLEELGVPAATTEGKVVRIVQEELDAVKSGEATVAAKKAEKERISKQSFATTTVPKTKPKTKPETKTASKKTVKKAVSSGSKKPSSKKTVKKKTTSAKVAKK